MKINNHKHNFVADTFQKGSNKTEKKVKKQQKKKSENTQLRLKKK